MLVDSIFNATYSYGNGKLEESTGFILLLPDGRADA
jgi:hypothetical protein